MVVRILCLWVEVIDKCFCEDTVFIGRSSSHMLFVAEVIGICCCEDTVFMAEVVDICCCEDTVFVGRSH